MSTSSPYLQFGDFPPEYTQRESARIALIPVPYDKTSTWQKGADKGPQALLAASPYMEYYDRETDSEVYRRGIFTDRPIVCDDSPDIMTDIVGDAVLHHLKDDRFSVVIGGEHSVSIGAIRAHKEWFKDLCVLQLDAHLDLRSQYENSPYNHACVMARAREMCPIVQAGIRSMDISEKRAVQEDLVFFAWDMSDHDDQWMRRLISKLKTNVYVTLDLDVFDPSIMPSTGTPEPGGLQWYPVLRLLKKIAAQRRVVGFDIVELCPSEANKAPDLLAAKLLYKFLGYIFEKSRDSSSV